MRAYFSQFGTVRAVKLSRSKRSARSRGFAFVQFADEQVARVAADAMDGYLMYGRVLQARCVPAEEVHPETFAPGTQRKFRRVPWRRIERERYNRERSATRVRGLDARMRSRQARKQRRLRALGIDYEFPCGAAAGEAGETAAEETTAAETRTAS